MDLSNQINTALPLEETQKELWEKLAQLNNALFLPSSSDTLKDFFQTQSRCFFKKGRRKGG